MDEETAINILLMGSLLLGDVRAKARLGECAKLRFVRILHVLGELKVLQGQLC
jgi:hypothetical protein